jgi:protein TonB
MLLTVDKKGKVTKARIHNSSGHKRLDQAARSEALRTWRLLPGTIGGRPATMQKKVSVTFVLEAGA